jgi:hypothetical protein
LVFALAANWVVLMVWKMVDLSAVAKVVNLAGQRDVSRVAMLAGASVCWKVVL